MQGKIIKGIAGFYYIYAEDGNVYECKAKGIFRKDNFKPLVGDNVEISILDGDAKEGSVTAILPRRNSLIRPAVANVDQAKLEQTLSVFMDRFQKEERKLPLMVDRTRVFVPYRDLYFLSSVMRTTEVHMKDKVWKQPTVQELIVFKCQI